MSTEQLVVLPVVVLLTGSVLQFLGARILTGAGKGWLAVGATASAAVAVAAMWPAVHRGEVLDAELGRWTGPARLPFHVDGLALLFALMATGIGAVILLYSVAHMAADAAATRFYVVMQVFDAGLVLLVFAADLVLMYAGWELVGLCSFLLVGFWGTDHRRQDHHRVQLPAGGVARAARGSGARTVHPGRGRRGRAAAQPPAVGRGGLPPDRVRNRLHDLFRTARAGHGPAGGPLREPGNYAMNRPGGVSRDLTDPAAVLATVQAVRTATTEVLIPVLTRDRSVRARCAGVGVLARDDALAHGAVGPVARASGLGQDIRRDQPYEAYDRVDFEVPVRQEGDVFARIVVRALEIVESCRIVEQAVEAMPAGPIVGDLFQGHVPEGETCVRIEAPRGELLYYLASDGSEVPARVRVRTPTFANMPTARVMTVGQTLSDLGLIQASIDLGYSCTDR